MTQEDVIRMAREAGMTGLDSGGLLEHFERFAALVAAAEREACAAICDKFLGADACGRAIRARGQE